MSSVITTEEIARFIDARHMSLAGLTVLAYDILLTAEEEMKVIWSSQRRNSSKTVYAFYRYSTLVGGSFFLSFMIPLWSYSDQWCTRAGMASVSFTAIVETVGNAIILHELIKLWACSRRMSCMMTGGFLLVHSGTLVATIFAISQLRHSFQFTQREYFRTCISTTKPPAFKGIFIPSVVLQLYWALLLFLNAMSRPRSSSQRLLNLLWNDGLVFFLAMFSLRVLSLIITVAAPTPIGVLGVSMPILLVNAVVCRLYLWLNSPHGLLLRRRLLAYGMEKDEWTDEIEVPMDVRSMNSSVIHTSFY